MRTCSTSRRMRTIRNEPRSKLCSTYWSRTLNSAKSVAFRLAGVAAVVLFSSMGLMQAQTSAPATPAPAAQAAAEPAKAPEAEKNPFAPEPAPPLPAGMTGADTNDPRFKLKAGLYDAGVAAVGMKHVAFVKKPAAFQITATSPDDPAVQKTLGQLGVSDTSKMPKAMQMVIAQLAFANSDFAFQGNHLFQGNFY